MKGKGIMGNTNLEAEVRKILVDLMHHLWDEGTEDDEGFNIAVSSIMKLVEGDYCGIDQKKCGRNKGLEMEIARLRKGLELIEVETLSEYLRDIARNTLEGNDK